MLFLPKHLIAHRGYKDQYPENSLIAITSAIHSGAVSIECDIQFCNDGIPILFHDIDIHRLCGTRQYLSNLSSNQLVQFFAHEPERFNDKFASNPITRLTDLVPVIQQNPGVSFYLELKEESIEYIGLNKCLQSMQTILSPVLHQCVFISYSQSAVTKAKQYGFQKTALVFSSWQQRDTLLAETKADFGFIDYQQIPENDVIQAIVPIIVFETCHLEIAQSLLTRGAMAVETFCIEQLLNGFKQHQQ